MKKISKILFLLMAVSMFAVSESNAQVSAGIYVGVRPERPRGVVVARPPRPSRAHVWVAEEWTPANGSYAYHPGRWVVPPRPGAVWIAGSWHHRHGRGYVWIPGHWA
jgi:hypothetical protein